VKTNQLEKERIGKRGFWRRIQKNRTLICMLFPALLYVVVFSYIPMFGVTIAFKNYNYNDGILKSPWCGFGQFVKFFTGNDFSKLLVNTLGISLLQLVLYFPAPIILSLFLNEVRHSGYKRVVQTLVYIPHFVSWVIIASIAKMLFNDGGAFDTMLWTDLHIMSTNSPVFWFVVCMVDVWKEMGWNAIIYMSAMAGIDTGLYEAAEMDGASRLQQIWYVTIPSILPTVMVMLIMNVGHLLSLGFEKILLMYTPANSGVSDIIDTMVYRVGLAQQNYSYATAIGLFSGIIGLIIVTSSNAVSKKLTGESIY